MSDLQEPTPNISSLSVLYPEGNFPSHIDIFGKGGFIALNDAIGGSGYNEFINERVTLERRKPGMLVYINSDNTYHKCATAGSSESTGEWDRQYFSGRYFYGASAPTASDVVIGEKWFNTDVGSEFTYLPIDENQNTFFWVDIDHLGQGESGDIGIDLLVNGVSFATDSPTLNITGSSPINVASEGGNGYRISLTDNFVNTSGDNMTGTLTGTNASFDSITASNGFIGTLTGTNASFDSITASNGFIGTLTGEKASFRNTQDGRASLEVAIGNTGYTDNFWDFVAGTIVNEEGLTSNVFAISTTSHTEIPSTGSFNGNLRVGQPTYNEKARLEVFGSISTTGNNNSSVLSTFRSPVLFRGFTAQNSDYWEGGANNLTAGSGYNNDLNVSLRAFNDVVLGRAHRNTNTPITFPREFITKEYAENNFGSGDIEIIDGTNISNEFSPYNWELTKIVLSRTDNGGTLLKSIYKIEPQVISNGNLAGNNITLNFADLCGSSTYDLLDISLDVTKNNTYESYGGAYSSAHSIHTNNIDKRFVNNNGAIKITYANDSPLAWFNNTIYLSCLFKI